MSDGPGYASASRKASSVCCGLARMATWAGITQWTENYSTISCVNADELDSESDVRPLGLQACVAHELGHYVHRDTWRSVAVGTVASGVLLVAAGALAAPDPEESLGDPPSLARFLFFANAIGLALGPALAAVSRSREWAAEVFAVEATAAPAAGASAFGRLRDRNLAEDEQPLWMEVLFSSHPSLRARIAALEDVAT